MTKAGFNESFSCRYPVGKYKIHVLDQIEEIVEINPSNGTLNFKDGSDLFGIVKAILLPPQDISPYFAHNFGSREKLIENIVFVFLVQKETT